MSGIVAVDSRLLEYARPVSGRHWCFAFAFLLILSFPTTFLITSIISYLKRKGHDDSRIKEPPTYPYWIPFLAHAVKFTKDRMSFFSEIKQKFGEAPATVWIGPMKAYAVPPKHYGTLINDTKTLTNKKLSEVAMAQVFGSPSQLYLKDRSGVMATPLPGRELPSHLRIWHFKHRSAQQFFNGKNLRQSEERMEACLSADLAQMNPNDPVDAARGDWVEIPDLYKWWRRRQMAAGLNALCGPHLVRLSPSIADDLWEFFEGWPLLALPLSSLTSAKTLRARRRILDGIKKWHAFALQHKDYEKPDLDYDEYWGGPHFRARYTWAKNSGMMDEEAIAAEDFSLIANASYNVKTLSFYIIAEVFSDPALFKRMQPEFEGMVTNLPERVSTEGVQTLTEQLHLDITRVCSSPLLLSVYAEILRLRVSAFLSRSPAQDDTSYDLGSYALKDDGQALLLLPMAHRNPELWRPERQEQPLDKFWADRFLDKSEDGTVKFSTASLQENAWFPYGGGVFVCPGKQLAKQQMLAAAVIFSAYFDMEMVDGVPASDDQFLGGSVPPPNRATRVRLRRKRGLPTVDHKAEK